ncbi:hypothetical protein FRX31_009648 [Thalictrum thalictroides]|uniref:Uncharacterized protein n=1 Tax=Thalictrum thalictroides TaxID=46969 RepID=A0A7J6WW64_THATH|nr:hypothetical protein FRX31_009648 [Thalictrum thalictroides]
MAADYPYPMKEVNFYHFIQSKAAEEEREPMKQTEKVLIRTQQVSNAWPIRKVITKGDIKSDSKSISFILNDKEVGGYIVPYLTVESRQYLLQGGSLSVNVLDNDDRNWSQLCLQLIKDNQVEVSGLERLSRKSLKVGDEIAMCWDESYAFFYYTILSRSFVS